MQVALDNPQVTAWLEQATQVLDFDKRKELYCKVVKIKHVECLVIFVSKGKGANGIRDDLKGFEAHPTYVVHYPAGGLNSTWLDR